MLKNLKVVAALMTVICLLALLPGLASAQSAKPSPRAEVTAAPAPVDPIEQSRKIKANLEMWPQRVRDRLTEANTRLKGLDFQQIKTQRLFASDFMEILEDLDEEASALQDSFSKVTTDLVLYREAVAQAPASFRALATAFEQKATENDDESLKIHYADFSAVSRSLATRYEAKHKTLLTLEKNLADKMAFVTKSRKFILDVREFISTIPSTEEGLEVERFVERLNTFVTVFQESIQMLKGLSDQVGKEPTSPGSKETEERTKARSREMTKRKISAEDVRQVVAQLAKSK